MFSKLENDGLTTEEVERRLDASHETLQKNQGDIIEFYREYVEYKKHCKSEPESFEEGIDEIRQYRKALEEIRDSDVENVEDDEQLEPYKD